MNFIVSANTDIGITKDTNQDSLSAMVLDTPLGRMAFAVLCDGMGGLEKGEVASATVVNAFRTWAVERLPALCAEPLADATIRSEWESIINRYNDLIKSYGARQGVRLGTTAVVMLLAQERFYVLNVGDSRAYEIQNSVRQITVDQTFVSREVSLGHMTEAEAETDSRRNVLLQCVGASEDVYPDMFFGQTLQNAVYMLCSDGFRHEITNDEMFEKFRPDVLYNDTDMQNNTLMLIDLVKQRQERDNISALLIRTF